MATQDIPGTAFAILPEEHQHSFRLLELPPELLSLLTSDDPPILELKSAETTADSSANANAVLCTLDNTYNIRQVSTSNDVWVTQPNTQRPNGEGGFPRPTIEAIAQCNSTTELQPATHPSATVYLRTIVPVYTSTGHHISTDLRTKDEHFSNVPWSAAECERAWRELACFQLKSDGGGCFVPSPKLKVQVWRAMLTTGTANGVDWEAPIDDAERALIGDYDEEWPLELATAILHAVCHDTANSSMRIHSDSLVRFVGLSLLEAKAASTAVSKVEFLHSWRDALPERWRNNVDLTLLQGSYIASDGSKSLKFVAGRLSSDDDVNGTVSTDGKSVPGSKRKWHEKFRQSKKAA